MSLKKSEPPLLVKLNPSRIALLFLTLLALASLLSVVIVNVILMLKFVLIILSLLVYCRGLSQLGWIKPNPYWKILPRSLQYWVFRPFVYKINRLANNQWLLHTQEQAPLQACLQTGSYLNRRLTVLNFKTFDEQWYHVLVLSDSTHESEFRKLRVSLRTTSLAGQEN